DEALIRAVVGWVDLRSERLEEQLSELAPHPKFKGVRHVVQDEPDDRFMLGEAFLNGISKLRQFGLTYDILIYPKQLPAAIELARSFPDQSFILDHIAKPHIREGSLAPWQEQIRELSQARNVSCKVSGMVTEANRCDWKAEDFQPYFDVVFEAFPAERLMWGSDWPVCLLAGKYEEVYRLVDDYSQQFDVSQQEALFGGTAARVYGIAD
ncbi:MAG: amidohydrolase, partial [Verrucomicrobiaceae bacterium]